MNALPLDFFDDSNVAVCRRLSVKRDHYFVRCFHHRVVKTRLFSFARFSYDVQSFEKVCFLNEILIKMNVFNDQETFDALQQRNNWK